MAQLPRCRLFCGTLFDPRESVRLALARGVEDGTLTYAVGQCELCPDTGRKHLQFFMCLVNRRTLRGIKTLLFNTEELRTVHLAACNGTSEANRNYCTKLESRDPNPAFDPFEFGTFADCCERNGQGSRTDLYVIGNRIRDGATQREIAQDYPAEFIRFNRGFLALEQALRCVPREWDPGAAHAPPSVNWFYGSTGSGKSRAAFTEALSNPLRTMYSKPAGNKWFDGYRGDPIILLDDYRGDWFSFSFLLRLLDVYPIQVECKGSMVPLCADTFFITCPLRPEILYANLANRENGRIQQLLRRITLIRLFGEEPEVDPPAPMYPGFNRG